ncbi:MAG: hypothetical protein ABUL64_03065, partial [Singulisphaera sp.]
MSAMRVVERERRILHELVQLVEQRTAAEHAADSAFRQGEQRITAEFQRATAEITTRFQQEVGNIERAERSSREAHVTQWKAQSRKIEEGSQDAVQRMVNEINRNERKAHKAVDEARWLARTVYEAARKRMSEHITELQQQLRSRLRTARAIEGDAIAWLERLGHRTVIDQTVIAPPDDDEALDHSERLNQALEAAKSELQALRALRLPDAVRGANAVWVFMAVAAVTVPTLVWLAGANLPLVVVGAAVITIAAGCGLTYWLRRVAQRLTTAHFRPLLEGVRQAETSGRRYLEKSAAAYKRKRNEIKRQRDAEYARATQEHAPMLAACRRRRETELPKVTADADQQLVVLQRHLDEELAQSQERESQQKADVRQRYEQQVREMQSLKERQLAANQAEHERARSALALAWQS